MSKTSSEVKNRYNSKAYDRIQITVKKGEKEKYKEKAIKKGMSLNKYIIELLERNNND